MSIPPPPDTKTCDREVLAIARFLRRNDTIKQRTALLGGQRMDMFKGKRAVRALLSPEYKAAQARPNSMLPEINDRKDALVALARLPQENFIRNVQKLETEDALAQGMKPQSGVPVTLIKEKQQIGDEEYMIWLYNPTPLKTYLYGGGLLAGGGALAFFQMWPLWARQGAYYVSLCSVVLLATLVVLGIVRLILFLLSIVVLPKGFWLFPNLFADVSFLQSFQPLWSWSGENTLPPKPKVKKRKSKPVDPAVSAAFAKKAAAADVSGSKPTTQSSAPGAGAGAGAPPGGVVGGAAPGTPGAPPVGAVLLAVAKTPDGKQVPMLLRQTPQGPQPWRPAPVAVTPKGPIVLTSKGPVPVLPNGIVPIPPGAEPVTPDGKPTPELNTAPGGGPAAGAAPGGAPGAPGAPGPPPQIQDALRRTVERANERVKEELKKGKPSEPVDKLREKFIQEEGSKEPALVMMSKAMEESAPK